MLLAKKSKNISVESMTGLEVVKRVLIFLSIVFTIAYSTYSLAFGIKFIINLIVAYIFAQQVEILFLTHQRKITREAAVDLIHYTKPEVSGLLLALLLPVNVPIYIIIIGIGFGIFITKMAFGGYSFNIFNVAISARVFIQASWASVIDGNKATSLIDYVLGQVIKTDYSKANSLLLNDISFEHFTKSGFSFLILMVSICLILAFIYLCINKVARFSNLFWPILLIIIIFSFLGLNASFIFGFISSPLVLLVLIFGLNEPYTTADSYLGRFVSIVIFVVVASFMMLTKNNGYGLLYALLFMNMLIPLIDAKLPPKAKSIPAIIFCLVLMFGSCLILKEEAPDVKAGASQAVTEKKTDGKTGASTESKDYKEEESSTDTKSEATPVSSSSEYNNDILKVTSLSEVNLYE